MWLANWLLIIIIGVFDAREHRIPNYLVLTLLAVSSVVLISEQFNGSGGDGVVTHLYGFIITFVVGLIFYSLKFMAAGDVKFVAVIGFILGHSAILIWVQYFAVSCCFIGTMYWSLNRLQMQSLYTTTSKDTTNKVQGKSNLIHHLWIGGALMKSDLKQKRNITYMPFAPVLIIALAMYQYFQH